MTKVKCIAIDQFDGLKPGDGREYPEKIAKELEAKGLVKMAGPPKNKMAQEPSNKKNPTQAAGKVKQSSASPAAQVSQKQTARRSVTGDKADQTEE